MGRFGRLHAPEEAQIVHDATVQNEKKPRYPGGIRCGLRKERPQGKGRFKPGADGVGDDVVETERRVQVGVGAFEAFA